MRKLETDYEPPTLTQQQIDRYVQAQNRNAGSLLAAFRLSQDEAYLTEALARFPNNPQVLLCALRIANDPGKKMELIKSLKQADPGNGIANLLAAKVLFDCGKSDDALAELFQSSGKAIQDFGAAFCQSKEKAYLAAGFSSFEAKRAAIYGGDKPEVIQMLAMAAWLEKLRQDHTTAGDDAAASSMRQAQSELGRHLQEDPSLAGALAGIVIEKASLEGADTPAAIARLEELDQRRNSLIEGIRKVSALMQIYGLPEGDWLLYFDCMKNSGENAANAWVLEKYPAH